MLSRFTRWRGRVGACIGGFEAAQNNRRLRHFVPTRAHLNALIAAAGADITARARWLVRNNGYAANAIESWAGNVVGNGITPSSLIADSEIKAQVQRLWLDWTDESDAEGFTDFYGQQRRVAREVFIAGEVFLRFRPCRPEDGLVVPLQLQMLPSRCCRSTATKLHPTATSSARASSSTALVAASPITSCVAILAIPPILQWRAKRCVSRPRK
jgi:capsid protein